MRFHFRLARVHHFLELKEREKKMEVAFLVQQKESFEQRKQILSEGIVHQLWKGQSQQELGNSWSSFRVQKISMNYAEIEALEQHITRTQRDLEQKLWELSRISMKKKALGELQEKRKREFDVEQSRKMQKELDEGFRLSKLNRHQ